MKGAPRREEEMCDCQVQEFEQRPAAKSALWAVSASCSEQRAAGGKGREVFGLRPAQQVLSKYTIRP